jgi:poly(3-hydroxybutyrate) depolymerase
MQIQNKLAEKQQFFVVYKNQVNKDLERSGFKTIDAQEPEAFLKELIAFLNEALTTAIPNYSNSITSPMSKTVI